MSYQVNWEIQALDQAAGFLRDDPIGIAALWDVVSQLADEPRLSVKILDAPPLGDSVPGVPGRMA